MKADIKEILTSGKVWASVIILITAGFLAIVKYQQLPERIEEAEEAIEANEDGIDKVAVTFDKYMTEQRVIQREEEKRDVMQAEQNRMMYELIKQAR